MSGAEAAHHAPTNTPTHAGGEVTLQGQTLELRDDAARLDVLEKAFDFRGDCTLTLRDGRTVTGYIFDRRRGPTPDQSFVRLLPPVGAQRLTIPFADVVKVEFGRDAAHGRSFETWLKKYVEKKRRGERASIESEPL
jgi:hypothetical protein